MTFVVAQRLLTDSLLRGSVRLTVDQATPPGSTTPDRSGSGGAADRADGTGRRPGRVAAHGEAAGHGGAAGGGFAGIQLMSRALTDRADLAHRISVLWSHILPGIAVPGLLLGLDSRADRGVRILSPAPVPVPVP